MCEKKKNKCLLEGKSLIGCPYALIEWIGGGKDKERDNICSVENISSEVRNGEVREEARHRNSLDESFNYIVCSPKAETQNVGENDRIWASQQSEASKALPFSDIFREVLVEYGTRRNPPLKVICWVREGERERLYHIIIYNDIAI